MRLGHERPLVLYIKDWGATELLYDGLCNTCTCMYIDRYCTKILTYCCEWIVEYKVLS
jgi:hypothetical protein